MPGLGVVYIAVVGCDVEITQYDDVFMLLRFGGQPGCHLLQPVKLVLEFLGTHFAAIDYVKIHNPDISYRDGQDAPLWVFQPRNVGDGITRLFTTQNRHTVVRFLA